MRQQNNSDLPIDRMTKDLNFAIGRRVRFTSAWNTMEHYVEMHSSFCHRHPRNMSYTETRTYKVHNKLGRVSALWSMSSGRQRSWARSHSGTRDWHPKNDQLCSQLGVRVCFISKHLEALGTDMTHNYIDIATSSSSTDGSVRIFKFQRSASHHCCRCDITHNATVASKSKHLIIANAVI
jgi:hypothetical protein